MNYGAPPPGGYGAPPGGGPPFGGPPGAPPFGGPPGPAYGPPAQGFGAPVSAVQTRAFPENLVDAPRELRIDETFGFFPGAIVVACFFALIGSVIALIRNEGLTIPQLEFSGGALAAIVVFGAWEVFRRARPTSLVLMNGQLGVYRKGKLDGVVSFGQISHFRLHAVNSLREYVLFGLFGFGSFASGAALLGSGQLEMAVWTMAVGLGGIVALASSIYARGMCFHYDLPKGSGVERVALRKKHLPKIGWPAA